MIDHKHSPSPLRTNPQDMSSQGVHQEMSHEGTSLSKRRIENVSQCRGTSEAQKGSSKSDTTAPNTMRLPVQRYWREKASAFQVSLTSGEVALKASPIYSLFLGPHMILTHVSIHRAGRYNGKGGGGRGGDGGSGGEGGDGG